MSRCDRPGGAADDAAQGRAGRQRVETPPAHPRAQVRRASHGGRADDSALVELVQLGDKLDLDRHHGKRLGRDLHGRREQRRWRSHLERRQQTSGRTDRRRGSSSRRDQLPRNGFVVEADEVAVQRCPVADRDVRCDVDHGVDEPPALSGQNHREPSEESGTGPAVERLVVGEPGEESRQTSVVGVRSLVVQPAHSLQIIFFSLASWLR